MRRLWIGIGGIALVVALAVAVRILVPGRPPPNILLIVADDVGTDKIAVYGEHPDPPRTPRIDALAAEGIRFTNAYAYPVCSPARAALLTGRYGTRNGLTFILKSDDRYELPLDEVTLPELLDRGRWDYASAGVGKWHLSGPMTPNSYLHPNLQGFDHFAGMIHQLYTDVTARRAKGNYWRYEKVVDGVPSPVYEYANAAATDDALGALAGMQEPWLLYVAYPAAHAPFHAAPGSGVSEDAPVPELYDSMVEHLDGEVGRLLDGLPPAVRQNTLVLFLADNGTDPQAVTAPRDPEHGKKSLYEGGTNIPFIVAGAGVEARGATTDALVHIVDVLPTIAEIVGIDASAAGKTLDGVSFADVLADPRSPGRRRYVYTEHLNPAGPPPYKRDWRAIRDDRYKLVAMDGEESFFDLRGRFDDGPPRHPAQLAGEERARYDELKRELFRITRDLRFEY